MKKFIVHVIDVRDALICMKASSAEAARKKGLKLAEKALNRLKHNYDISAYDYDEEWEDEITATEEDLK